MDGTTVSAVTEFLVNILIGSFSLATLSWVVVGIQTFINDRKREKRESEYHLERMKELRK
jgi:hypothetical protein